MFAMSIQMKYYLKLSNWLNNFNHCQYNDMAKENEINIVRWLKWNNFVTYIFGK